MLDIRRMAKNEELAVKMIFSSEQPLTGMNEGTWFPRRMCRKIEGLLVGGELKSAPGLMPTSALYKGYL